MKYRYLVILLLVPMIGNANVFAQWGVASQHPGTKHLDQVKFVEFGVAGDSGKLAYTVGVGGWHDSSGYMGGSGITVPDIHTDHFNLKGGELQEKARDSLFVESLFGVEPKSDHFYMGYKLGPVIITNTDALLGSNIQIGHEFGFGMRDVRDVRVGIVVKHYSNAGVVRPNMGRDFIGMRMEW